MKKGTSVATLSKENFGGEGRKRQVTGIARTMRVDFRIRKQIEEKSKRGQVDLLRTHHGSERSMTTFYSMYWKA
jgi:hypothetical protein